MHVESRSEAEICSEVVLGSLKKLGVSPTPENYALWYDYHSGANIGLVRTMDTLLFHGALFDETTLRDLYRSFLSSAKEEKAVREASLHALETLQDVFVLTECGRADARQFGATLSGFAAVDLSRSMESLKSSIERLVTESRRMASRTEYLGARIQESSDKIQKLERNLECALREATMDALTGIANRKSFDQTIRKMAGDAMNSGEHLALLMIDIDHFKRVNDTWGHPVGDALLRHVASLLELVVRGEDYVARYGGEEFSVLLPRTDVRAAVVVAENIRQSLARSRFSMDLEPPMGPVTVSIGAACYEPGDPLADWIQKSDAALYRAKAEGRDRVNFVEEEQDA